MENVFGTAITNEYLKNHPDYEGRTKDFSVKELAQYALDMMNENLENENARDYLKKLHEKYGSEGVDCMIYNATGAPMNSLDYKSWAGGVLSEQPKTIQNGQWGVFLHSQTKDGPAAKGAVVYDALYQSGEKAEWLLGWRITADLNVCFADISESLTFSEEKSGEEKQKVWNKIDEGLTKIGLQRFMKERKGKTGSLFTHGFIGGTKKPVLDVILSIIPQDI